MSSFFTGRDTIEAKTLHGSRIYSTDLHPSHFSAQGLAQTVEVGIRALKVKLLTKGVVTVHTSHLVSPGGVEILKRHPELIECRGLLPAFRNDKDSIDEYVVDQVASYARYGVAEADVAETVGLLNRQMTRVMPWHLGQVGENYRQRFLAGLADDNSMLSRKLAQAEGFLPAQRDLLMKDLSELDVHEDGALRRYLDQTPVAIRPLLKRYEQAVYHQIGTQVVNCETGTDLSPLSSFRVSDQLSDQLDPARVFLNDFFAIALEAIESEAMATSALDTLRFSELDRVSERLAEAGFRDQYDALVAMAIDAAGASAVEALENLETDRICEIVHALDEHFEGAVYAELPHLRSRAEEKAVESVIGSGRSLAVSLAGLVPYIGNLVSGYEVFGSYRDFHRSSVRAARHVQSADPKSMAIEEKKAEIKAAIEGFPLSGTSKTKLLDAAMYLLEIHRVKICRV